MIAAVFHFAFLVFTNAPNFLRMVEIFFIVLLYYRTKNEMLQSIFLCEIMKIYFIAQIKIFGKM